MTGLKLWNILTWPERFGIMVLSATFNNISVISWWLYVLFGIQGLYIFIVQFILSKPDAIQTNILSENGRRCDNTLDKFSEIS